MKSTYEWLPDVGTREAPTESYKMCIVCTTAKKLQMIAHNWRRCNLLSCECNCKSIWTNREFKRRLRFARRHSAADMRGLIA